jgi:ADP-Ribosyltransferase in polyvalent proteins
VHARARIDRLFEARLYHGTKRDFKDFELGHPGKNNNVFGSWEVKRNALFFSEDPRYASHFAMVGGSTQGANVRPVRLDVKNPVDLRHGFYFDDAWYEQHGLNPRYYQRLNPDEVWEAFDDPHGELLVAALKASGFDGARLVEPDHFGKEEGDRWDPDRKNPPLVQVWVAFDPSQVHPALRE